MPALRKLFAHVTSTLLSDPQRCLRFRRKTSPLIPLLIAVSHPTAVSIGTVCTRRSEGNRGFARFWHRRRVSTASSNTSSAGFLVIDDYDHPDSGLTVHCEQWGTVNPFVPSFIVRLCDPPHLSCHPSSFGKSCSQFFPDSIRAPDLAHEWRLEEAGHPLAGAGKQYSKRWVRTDKKVLGAPLVKVNSGAVSVLTCWYMPFSLPLASSRGGLSVLGSLSSRRGCWDATLSSSSSLPSRCIRPPNLRIVASSF
jgi:hypothetical protein